MVVMVAHCEHTKHSGIIHLKGANCVVCDVGLKDVQK